jgi:hypothetical protein
LALADEGSRPLEAIQLTLDGIQRNAKVPRSCPAIGFAIMKKMKKNRFRGPASK